MECQLQEAIARREAESLLADARIRVARLRVREIGLKEFDAENLHRRIGLLQRNRDLAQNQLERLQNLKKPGHLVGLSDPLVTDQELERQRLAVDQVCAELAMAEGDLERLTRTRRLAEDMARAELDAAEASKRQVLAAIPTESLNRRLELSRDLLAETTIRAPMKGTILRVFMEPGETIGNRPILQMADLDQMVAVAEVYETDVRYLGLGQPAIITSPAFPRPHNKRGLRGRIVQIGRTVSTPQLKSLDPFARSDRHVIPIRVKLDDDDIRHAADFVNLQVVVTFPKDRE
jgi:HlyD family secretion protein